MTVTRRFGTGRRESHDASVFYDRFGGPVDTTGDPGEDPAGTPVPAGADIDGLFVVGDARDLSALPTGSVALVVTSPPYFVGKTYEQTPGVDCPADWDDYLGLLGAVFTECRRVLVPGGRIAVNVANLGRRPWRHLAGEVSRLLEATGYLLRGEIVWVKARGSSGSCAWGSWRSPSNPVLRDLTERIVVASAGRMRRAAPAGVPAGAPTITRDGFLAATVDLWEIPPESARRVGHPAPFPVELARRLILCHTWPGELVLDPFMGSGTTAVAARLTGRRWVGYDTDPACRDLTAARVADVVPEPVPDGGDPVAVALADQGAVAGARVRLAVDGWEPDGDGNRGGPVRPDLWVRRGTERRWVLVVGDGSGCPPSDVRLWRAGALAGTLGDRWGPGFVVCVGRLGSGDAARVLRDTLRRTGTTLVSIP